MRFAVVAALAALCTATVHVQKRSLLTQRSKANGSYTPNIIHANEILPPSIVHELDPVRVQQMADQLDKDKTVLIRQFNYINGLENQYKNDMAVFRENVNIFETFRDSMATDIAEHSKAVASIAPEGFGDSGSGAAST